MRTKLDNYMDLFNEACILSVCHSMTICLNVALKTEANDFIGWLMIVVTSFNILSNLAVSTYLSVPKILKNQRRRLATIRMQKLIKKWEEID